ncbi:MAG: hypothetical protein SOW31_03470 [Treponema sp.]|nr:hypothetical protein [Treponema sp.]
MRRLKLFYKNMLFILVLMLCGCKLSYESMVDELNSNFSPAYKEPSIMDPDYDYSSMIPSGIYEIKKGNVLMIEAPKDGDKYYWLVENSKNNEVFEITETINEVGTNIPMKEEGLFFYRITEGVFLSNEKNILKLIVMDKRGVAHKDEAYVYLID